MLRTFESRSFVVNEETFDVLEKLKVPQRLLALRHEHEGDTVLNARDMQEILEPLFPDSKKGTLHRTSIVEASAIACSHRQTGGTIVEGLVCDDAPQFKLLTGELALCWAHEARHYTRLSAYRFMYDRIGGRFEMLSLADAIEAKHSLREC